MINVFARRTANGMSVERVVVRKRVRNGYLDAFSVVIVV